MSIGGIEYDLEVRYVQEVGTCYDLCEAWFARNVGLLRFSAYSDFGPGDMGEGIDLRYAEVGGVVYGQRVVANEDVAPGQTFELATLYPNPFRSTVTLVLSLPASEPVTLSETVYEVWRSKRPPSLLRSCVSPTQATSPMSSGRSSNR